MWLRDSASQLYSYLHFLSPESSSVGGNLKTLNSLWRGLINSHSRYIIISPYCHSFQPPPESGIPPTTNGAYHHNNPRPAYDPALVFDCKWELDSLASFLQVSSGYYERTKDLAFFARYNWVDAVKAAVDAAAAMTVGTYDEEGRVLPSAWTFTGWTNRGSETLTNDGLGNPSKTNGMVRTAFRPSDDATIFQFLVPANMMFATYLEEASIIMEALAEGGKSSSATLPGMDADKTALAANVTIEMRSLAAGIRRGIDRDAVVEHRDFGEIFAYECDGFGGVNLMDDANVPSLLSMPLFGYARGPPSRFGSAKGKGKDEEGVRPKRDYAAIYQNTRRFALSLANPYYAKGPEISAVGGPHLGPGKAWPMAALVAGMTAFDEETGLVGPKGKGGVEEEVAEQLSMVLNSTSGMGVVHETVNSWNGNAFTRAWFGWANGLMGELIIRIEEWERKANKLSGDGLLGRSWQ
jgi:meiotically up-regulated gene 157 (Mug157) protein